MNFQILFCCSFLPFQCFCIPVCTLKELVSGPWACMYMVDVLKACECHLSL